MLSDNFYDIQSFTCSDSVDSEQQVKAVTRLNAGHPIFEGHFPGNPVVPGVCQVQMVKELVEKELKNPVRLYESDNIKFLSMINPLVNSILEFNIHIKPIAEKQFAVNATIGSGSFLFLKFKGKFEFEQCP
jgi:3-hydroxyacyl-[acyl-carrier-protein] dehydratase